jgi:hypothetical protein
MTTLLIHGLSKALKGTTFNTEENRNSELKRMHSFVHEVEGLFNESILGCHDNPPQWMLPIEVADRKIGTITMDNNRTRLIVRHINALIDCCIVDVSKKNRYKSCIGKYRDAIIMLRKKSDFTDDQIVEFQRLLDDFFQEWVSLDGDKGVTNYIHMLGSGHISDYLFHWRNLYQHSQQGWESFNALMKTVWFRRTGRGGAGNHGTGKKSRVLPIARWLSRRIIWMCGYTMEEIEERYYEEMQKEAEREEDEENSDDEYSEEEENSEEENEA